MPCDCYGLPVSKGLRSIRLRLRPLVATDAPALLRIVQDEHVLRYLLDGEAMTLPWCVAQVEASEALFEEYGVGLWLVYTPEETEAIGFAGFLRFEETGHEPQLVYALLPSATGRGLATELSTTLVGHAEAVGFARVIAAVDEPNVASIRVLEKTGFVRTGSLPGAFGEMITFERKL